MATTPATTQPVTQMAATIPAVIAAASGDGSTTTERGGRDGSATTPSASASVRTRSPRTGRQDLDHLGDAAAATPTAPDVHHDVERRLDGSRTAPEREVTAALEHHDLQPPQRVERAVGVARGERAVVAGAHGHHHVEGLRPTDLADDEAIGPHAQRSPHEIADGHLAGALGAARPGLQPHDVGAGSDSSAASSMVMIRSPGAATPARALSSVVLPAEVGPADQDVGPRPHRGFQQLDDRGRGERRQRDGGRRELPDGEAGPVDGQRGHDGVHPGAAREAGVDDGAGAVDPAPEGRDDPLDEVEHGGGVERQLGLLEAAVALDPHPRSPLTITSVTVGSVRSASSGPSPWTRATTRRTRSSSSAPWSNGARAKRDAEPPPPRRRRRRRRPGGRRRRAACSRCSPQAPLEQPRQPAGQQPCVDGAGDRGVDLDLGPHGEPSTSSMSLAVRTRPGSRTSTTPWAGRSVASARRSAR